MRILPARLFPAVVTMLLVALLASCDTKPPPTPSTPAAELARIPLADLRATMPPAVISISPNAKRVALRIRGNKTNIPGDTSGVIDVTDAIELLKIYNTTDKQWEKIALPTPENQKLVAVHFSPDGRFQVGLFLGAQPHRELRVFRTQDQAEMFTAKTDLHGLAPITFSPDGKSLLLPTPPDEKGHFALSVVSVVSGAARATFPIDLRTISRGVFHQMAFTPDGGFIYGHQAKQLFIWNVATGQLATEWNWLGAGDIATMGSTPDSRVIRALMEDGTIATIDLPAANSVRTSRLNVPPVSKNQPLHIKFETSWSFNRAAFTSDGASVLRDATGQLDIFDMQTGNFSRSLTLPAGAGPVDFTARQGDLVPVQVRAPGGDSIAIIRIAP